VLCTISLSSAGFLQFLSAGAYDGKKAARHPDGSMQFTSRLPLHSCCCLCLFSDPDFQQKEAHADMGLTFRLRAIK
jgi:hypothetical protein